MSKKSISIAIVIFMVITNVYLIMRINANTMSMTSYDAGISQRSGVGKLESFWTGYVGGSKDSSFTAEDRANAESDSTYSIIILVVLDIACFGALYKLNHKPKPAPVQDDDDWRIPRRGRRLR